MLQLDARGLHHATVQEAPWRHRLENLDTKHKGLRFTTLSLEVGSFTHGQVARQWVKKMQDLPKSSDGRGQGNRAGITSTYLNIQAY